MKTRKVTRTQRGAVRTVPGWARMLELTAEDAAAIELHVALLMKIVTEGREQ